MPATELTDDKLPHAIVYWPPAAAVNAGQPGYGEPVQMAGRWVLQEVQVQTADGSVITSRTQVWGEDAFAKNGFVMKGTLDDLVSTTLPQKNAGAYRIREIGVIPTVDGEEEVNLAYL